MAKKSPITRRERKRLNQLKRDREARVAAGHPELTREDILGLIGVMMTRRRVSL
jgi:hypothetical protein